MTPTTGPRISALALATAFLLAACSGASATATQSPSPAATAVASAPAPTQPASAPTACGPAAPAGAVYSMATCKLPAPSLAGNKLGDAAVVDAYILTPDGYDGGTGKYPVVYVLAGYTDPATGLAASIGAASPSETGKVSPIVVVVSGVNALGGGFYVNSSVTGNWEDAIAKDVIGYVDGHYRTIAAAASRGIAGHSMGGFGAVNLAMRHPELFGALFAESAGLFDPTGAVDRVGKPDATTAILDLEKNIAGLSAADAIDQIELAGLSGGEDVRFELAYGMAFSPNPSKPLLMDFPFGVAGGQTVRDDAVWAKWEGGFGDLPAKIARYKANLAGLKGIAIDWGTRDEYPWIPRGCAYFVSELKSAGISATATTFDGGHNEQAGPRLATQMLPFMIGLLATS